MSFSKGPLRCKLLAMSANASRLVEQFIQDYGPFDAFAETRLQNASTSLQLQVLRTIALTGGLAVRAETSPSTRSAAVLEVLREAGKIAAAVEWHQRQRAPLCSSGSTGCTGLISALAVEHRRARAPHCASLCQCWAPLATNHPWCCNGKGKCEQDPRRGIHGVYHFCDPCRRARYEVNKHERRWKRDFLRSTSASPKMRCSPPYFFQMRL